MSTFKWRNTPAISAKRQQESRSDQWLMPSVNGEPEQGRAYQTTGCSSHLAARIISTVERESIDLLDKTLAVCVLSINVIRLFNQGMEKFIKVIPTVQKEYDTFFKKANEQKMIGEITLDDILFTELLV
ncbi:6063_t:CDS:2 [Paraglomus brasilianum]|uniref:6063_t:CDS:1 n=1 Tax=Paraglomus brasilianum TaxID=144538 RepID=A0A9N9GMP0_9GLOM|nr:6063_t:CDS:2 [Paraglomus brasilianum]